MIHESSSHIAMPIIFLVDDDAVTVAELCAVVSRRYGNDYQVLTETSPLAGARRLQGLRDQGAVVALIIADQWMPELNGIDFLIRAHELHPAAKRALLITSMDVSAFPSMLQATALGRIDRHLHKPWAPAEDWLHPAITELLSEWSRQHRGKHELVFIIGEQWDPRSHELRDLLSRNNIPSGFLAADSEAAGARLHSLGVSADQLPVVALFNGKFFVQPSNVELAEAFGVRTHASGDLCDLAIVGAGPAGLAAAVYAASEGLHTIVVEPEAMGGQAGTSSMIRNYLGFPRGVSGTELAQHAYSQAMLFGTEFIFMQKATALNADGDIRIVTLSDNSQVRARTVILATGVSYRRLQVPGIDRLVGAGVFYGAASTEARAMEGEHVYVVGAANSGGQAAVHLAKYAKQVTLIARRSLSTTMSAYLMREIHRTRNIAVRLNCEVAEVRGEQRLEGLVLRDTRTGALETVATPAVFILIGAAPHTDWLQDTVQRDANGFILTGAQLGRGNTVGGWPLERAPYYLETSMPGVFAAGDVRQHSIKRVAAAVGEGSMAISFVHEYLADSQTSDQRVPRADRSATG